MKILFNEKNRDQVLSRIKGALEGRRLAELVSFGLSPGFLEVTISKLGTSSIKFQETETQNGLEYSLHSEKIAFAHRAFRSEVQEKIMATIVRAGGQVEGQDP